ncbi:kinase-like protein [Hesseltinella vesiculosa]|uniref:Kinase-like protein n=1 Tax=Hesseltinella vesiculosa TaxID=101127 RepID=A0A1X2GJ07_9FUNG|nr:kinase-like protein [Hesseltinella vesiculosa]
MASMTATTGATRLLKRKRKPVDWEKDFYKNGYPKEVIVIDDSPTPPPHHNASSSSSSSSNGPTIHTPAYGSQMQHYPSSSSSTHYHTAALQGPTLHPDEILHSLKKRRKELQALPAAASLSGHLLAHDKSAVAIATKQAHAPYDDKDGHLIMQPNDYLTARYKVMRMLGQGTFGKVVECYDRVRRTFCAIKVIRAIPKYREASKIEIRVLTTLKERDPLNLHKCIHLLEWFDYRNHICMVFELLGQSVFDFLKSNEFKPFPSTHIQHFAKQLLTSVAFLHDLKLIHTDLKPENILLVSQTCHMDNKSRVLDNTEIRLIDFGSATFEQDYHASVVCTRHYRAPEIILGSGWSYPCDIWSVGCILVELFTGEALFHTHENLEHLALMEACLGKIPAHVSRPAATFAQKYFKNSILRYPDAKTTRQSREFVAKMKTLNHLITPDTPMNVEFRDLISKMLVYDAKERITAREALRHSFFTL